MRFFNTKNKSNIKLLLNFECASPNKISINDNLIILIWIILPSKQRQFQLFENNLSYYYFYYWCFIFGAKKYAIINNYCLKYINLGPVFVVAFYYQYIVFLLRRLPTEAERASVTRLISTLPRKVCPIRQPFGVNLYGYAYGELGIGEDIRQMSIALQSQGIPVCILNFQPGSNISQADRSADSLIVTEPRYGINIFCMTGIETTRYVCEKGLSALEGRYNIGLWPWELPDWPESCRHAYACVDEIWGISEYTARAHRHAAPRPVMPMSLPVELGVVGEQNRSDFGLPENPFLFYFAFDINSNAARKNPEGLIEAFQKAFPTENQDQVGLVLKISHPETSCKLWSKIRKIAKRDKRIRVVEKTLRRPELLALFKACDCMVSLHRAEGFGRCIAEALLLDKQVIATGFSGNLDFCHEPRVALVRHSMKALTAKDYMWGEGQSWAEPDLDHAAELMRSIWINPRETRHRDFDFSPSTVGRRYSARLEEIWKSHAADPRSADFSRHL